MVHHTAKRSFIIINGITIYRIVSTPVLLYLLVSRQFEIFRWLLASCFFTDAIDGFLSRYFNSVSLLGSRLDSIGDDLTVMMAIIGIFFLNPEFIKEHLPLIIGLFILYLAQNGSALFRYGKLTSFHTYLAKLAAVIQAIFLLTFFFLQQAISILFLLAVVITALELIEEIILITLLPKYQTDVKGIYWALRKKSNDDR